jgi:hypothetical protein
MRQILIFILNITNTEFWSEAETFRRLFHPFQENIEILLNMKISGDYKWCERLHKFIDKKVLATQKTNSNHCKEKLKKLFLFLTKFQYVLRLLPCTHQDDIQLRTTHFAIKAEQFLQPLFVFDPSSCSELQALAEREPHLSQSPTGKSRGGGSDLEIAEARKWPPSAD